MARPISLDPPRSLLSDVPPVHFYDGGKSGRCPEDFPFFSCVRSWLEHNGGSLGCTHAETPDKRTGCTYALLMTLCGYSGSAAWNPGQWDHGFSALDARWDDVRVPIDQTLQGIGRSGNLVGNADRQGRPGSIEGLATRADESAMRHLVAETIAEGQPLLAFGVVGPPECCLICGYEEGGDVLVGWSFFTEWEQNDPDVDLDPSGMFRRRNWYPNTLALLTISPQTRTDWTIPYREMVERNLAALHAQPVGPFVTGIAVWDAWAHDLESETRFGSDDLEVLMNLHMPHTDAVGNVAEARWYGCLALREAAVHLPEAKAEIRAAADCYKQQHDLMWNIWNAAGGNGIGETLARALAEPSARQAILPLMAQAKSLDIQAAVHLERALAKL